MPEAIYTLLLRLYPAEFRDAYGREALQLVRDRARDERGIVLQLRLLLDLTLDLLVATLRSRRGKLVIVADDYSGGVPSFRLLEWAGPRPAPLVVGMVLAIVLMATFTQAIHAFGDDQRLTQLRTLTRLRAGLFQSSGPGAQTPDAIDAAVRRNVIDTVAAHLKQYYANPAIGRQLSDAVLAHDRNRDYDSASAGDALADRLTQHIRETGRALGIAAGEFVADVLYSPRPLPPEPPPPDAPVQRTPEALERYRSAILQENCLFARVETLPGNVGYLKLNGFPDATVCQAKTSAAMASVNGVDALILDLRDNAGGYGNTAMQIAAYLFDRPEFMFDPRENTSPRAWTSSPVSGSRLTETPVYVLTSSRTFSAAEYFTYNLKMLKRATIVGETTRGGQHSGIFKRIDDHFGMGIQHVAPINPFPVKGWEVIGVEPDVKVPAIDAFETAKNLARLTR